MEESSVLVKKRYWEIFRVLLIILIFYSLNCWPFFDVNVNTMRFLSFGFIFPFLFVRTLWDFSVSRVKIAFILVILQMYTAGIGNINLYIMSFIVSVPLVVLILLRKELLVDLLECFQKVLSIILGLGIIFWILHLIGYDLPSQDISFGLVEDHNGRLMDQYYFSNHYLYLVNKTWFIRPFADAPSFLRFSSIFLEPGYLAIMMMFLLFINKFDFKSTRGKIYLATLVLTLSLAGFIMTILAFVAHKMQYSRRRISILFSIGLTLFIGYHFFTEYNGGKNVVNEAIISRLQIDKEKGIAGNNRTSEAMDAQYKAFLTSPQVIYGLRDSKKLEYGVGYKAYLIKNGLIGLSLFVVFLFMIAKLKNNYRSFVLMGLYLLMFARGDATMFYMAFIMIYLVGVLQSTQEKQLLQ